MVWLTIPDLVFTNMAEMASPVKLSSCHEHNWKLSGVCFKNIQWFHAYKCWNTDSNCGHQIGSPVACRSTTVPSTSRYESQAGNKRVRWIWFDTSFTNGVDVSLKVFTANILSRRLGWNLAKRNTDIQLEIVSPLFKTVFYVFILQIWTHTHTHTMSFVISDAADQTTRTYQKLEMSTGSHTESPVIKTQTQK